MIFDLQVHTLPLVLCEDIRADSSGLLHLQLRRVLQSSLQRCGCQSASAGMQTATDPMAFEGFGDVFSSSKSDHAEILRGNYETEGPVRGFRKSVEHLREESVSRK